MRYLMNKLDSFICVCPFINSHLLQESVVDDDEEVKENDDEEMGENPPVNKKAKR